MSVGDITSNIMLAVKGRSDTGMIEQGLAQLTMHVSALKSALGKAHAQINSLNKRLNGFENQTKKNTKTTRGFKIELMAMMFFWRQIGGAALGLLQPAAEAFGIMEMWSTMLLVTFIPIMEELAPLLYGLMDWFMNLPEPIQKVIGGFTLLVAAFSALVVAGGILSAGIQTMAGLFGATTLAVGGLVIAFGVVITWILLMKEEMGGWGNFWINVLNGVLSVVQFFTTGLIQYFVNLYTEIGKLLSAIPITKSVGDAMQAVAGEVQTANQDMDAAFIAMREESLSWMTTTVKNNNLVANSFNKLSLDMSSSLERIKNVYGQLFSMQLQNAASANKGAKGAFADLGYNSAAAKSPGVATVPGSYKTNPNAKKMNDFVWRAGEGAVAISPDDNLVGTKKGTPGMSGSGVVINQTINVGIAGRDEIAKMIAENNRKLTADIQRIIG